MSASAITKGVHEYAARLIWDGNTGEGTAGYTSYGRQYRVLVAGKPDLAGTADPAFRGEADKHNPEDLFLASLSACHMLFYLSLCARKGVRVLAYEDDVQGRMVMRADGGGKFEEVTLHPSVTIADGKSAALAAQLHDTAHELCFIANSCSVPIRHEATVRVR
ncbi:MAG: OsmC family protein [Gemmatimonadetes bacterium]|nr:OsmC family protein [Gemmatimonadota bacterium]